MALPYALNPMGQNSGYFELTAKTTTANQVVNLSQGTLFTVWKDWGDGTIDTENTHTYSTPGTYLIKERILSSFRDGAYYFYPWRSSNIIDCNWNWFGLNVNNKISYVQTNYMTGFNYTGRPMNTLPEGIVSLAVFCGYPSTIPAYFQIMIPDQITSMSSIMNANSFAGWNVRNLPANVTTIYRAFRLSGGLPGKSTVINIGEICKNAPAGGFQFLTDVTGFANGVRATNGTVAQFLQKCPNVKTVKAANNTQAPFNASYATLFDLEQISDHVQFTINIANAGDTWGFTPVSTGGLWCLVQWGDSSDVENISNTNSYIYSFTSGQRVYHTYSTAGTYTVKLAMHAESATFDNYVSTVGDWKNLGLSH